MNKKEQKRTKVIMLLIDTAVAALLLTMDQFRKYLAIQRLKDNPAKVLIKGVLELNYLENRGSAFGMLQNQKFFILFIGIVFLAVILFFMFKLPVEKKFRVVHILLSAVIAGGIGNMIDRFRFDYVVDFISFVLINFPVFNVADCYVTVAAFLLILLIMWYYQDEDLAVFTWKRRG